MMAISNHQDSKNMPLRTEDVPDGGLAAYLRVKSGMKRSPAKSITVFSGVNSMNSKPKTKDAKPRNFDHLAVLPSITPEAIQRNTHQILLVEALLSIVCQLYEPDKDRAKTLFDIICSQLFPQSHVGWNPCRVQFQKSFEDLIRIAQSHMLINDGQCNPLFSPPNFMDQLNVTAKWFNTFPRAVKEIFPNWNIITLQESRYRKEFQEISKIDKGGGGTVYKAKSRMDNCVYAMKKIPVTFEKTKDNIFAKLINEVKVLATLNHPNIVNYKTSWIDRCFEPHCSCYHVNEEHSSDESSDGNNNRQVCAFRNKSPLPIIDLDLSYSSDSIVFEDDSNSNPKIIELDKDADVCNGMSPPRRQSFSRSRSHDEAASYIESVTNNNDKSQHVQDDFYLAVTPKLLWNKKSSSDQGFNIHPNTFSRSRKPHMVLIIQMELCSMTLQQWLDDRNVSYTSHDELNETDEKNAMNIFKRILQGVEYFHSENIIHRDLKPSNIFLSLKNCVPKIGDFGLATVLAVVQETDETGDHVKGYTTKIGTKPYTSPEQLKSKIYDQKTDMYSLGVILIELLCPFKTRMEKSRIIDDMKHVRYSAAFEKRWAHHTKLVKRLLSENPSDRPTSKEILGSNLFTATDTVKRELLPSACNKLKVDLRDSSSIIETLMKENDKLRKRNEQLLLEIERLQHLVNNNDYNAVKVSPTF